jgi:N-acyl-D-amino-acid deacylase
MAANVTIFSAETVSDRATFEDSFQYPVGIPNVIVNGVIGIGQGKHFGAKSGRMLSGRGRRSASQSCACRAGTP